MKSHDRRTAQGVLRTTAAGIKPEQEKDKEV
jgi:hypothetical protein